MATSFYNENDEPLAPFLCKILMETNQPIPDFLEPYKPADGETIDFHDDSAAEDDEGLDGEDGVPSDGVFTATAVNDNWGNPGHIAAGVSGGDNDDGWGTTTFAARDDGGW